MLLAGSVEHSVNYYVVNEDVFFPHPGMSGGEHPFVRADIVYFTTPQRRGDVQHVLDLVVRKSLPGTTTTTTSRG